MCGSSASILEKPSPALACNGTRRGCHYATAIIPRVVYGNYHRFLSSFRASRSFQKMREEFLFPRWQHTPTPKHISADLSDWHASLNSSLRTAPTQNIAASELGLKGQLLAEKWPRGLRAYTHTLVARDRNGGSVVIIPRASWATKTQECPRQMSTIRKSKS